MREKRGTQRGKARRGSREEMRVGLGKPDWSCE